MPTVVIPGINVSSLSAPPPGPAGARTGAWFVTGQAAQGAVGVPISVNSMAQFANVLGGRQSYSSMYDALDLFFREGGTQAYVSRVVGPAAAPAAVILKDGAPTPANTVSVAAQSPGLYGNGLSVAVQAGTVVNTYQLVVTQGGLVVEVSPNLTSPTDAVNWGALSSQYVFVTDLHSATAAPANNPAVASAVTLVGGLDDLGNAAETQWTNALAVFTNDLGPGQVSAPGRTTPAAYAALITHATANNRTAFLDVADNASAAALTPQSAAARANPDPSTSSMFAPWVLTPGLTSSSPIPSAPRAVPPSALAAALAARNDNATGNPNIAAAGANGTSSYAIGVTHAYVDSDRGILNAAGINVIRSFGMAGAASIQLYGYRTLTTDPNWVQLTSQRLRMALTDDGQRAAATVAEFGQLDGQGHLFSKLNGALSGVLQGYYALGAIYGAKASDAYRVETGPAVNTPAAIALGIAGADMAVRMSPFAETTNLVLVRVPITQPV